MICNVLVLCQGCLLFVLQHTSMTLQWELCAAEWTILRIKRDCTS